MFKNFSQRLKRDLKNIVDSRVALSESASGGHMRVSIFTSSLPRFHATRADSPSRGFVSRAVFGSRSERYLSRQAEIRCLVRRKFDGFAGESNLALSSTSRAISSLVQLLTRSSLVSITTHSPSLTPTARARFVSSPLPLSRRPSLLVQKADLLPFPFSSLLQADYEEYGPSIVRKFSTFGSPH